MGTSNQDFFAGAKDSYRLTQTPESETSYWVTWALGAWVEGNPDNVTDSFSMLPPNAKIAIVQEILGCIGVRTILPQVVNLAMQGALAIPNQGIPLFELGLMLLAKTDDSLLKRCGIAEGTDLKEIIGYYRNVGDEDMASFLTQGEPRTLFPFLDRVIKAAGKIRDAQCVRLESASAPILG